MNGTSGVGGWFVWMYEGVDHRLAGNGGEECMQFIPLQQKIIESVIFITIGLLEILYSLPRVLKVEYSSVMDRKTYESPGRSILLMILCLVFGVELGFKLVTKQIIWLLNPCHLVTMMQIYLLCAPPSRLASIIFRTQLHWLNGATVAILLPIVNTRLMPFETHVYYIQHGLLLVVPFYLLKLGGPYTAESYKDFTWVTFTLGILFVYHWFPLQLLAWASRVNLNNIMCPAVSDPFHGVWYRVCAATHQTLLISFHGKLYTYLSSLILGRSVTSCHAAVSKTNGVKHHNHSTEGVVSNGHCKDN